MSDFYTYTLDGVSFTDPVIGIESLSRSIIREWSGSGIENILRKRSESSLTFTGAAYNYLCDKQSNLCNVVRLEVFSQSQLFYEGDIYMNMLNANLTKGTVETQVKDTSWSSLLRDRVNIDVYLLYKKSYDCSVDVTPPTPVNYTFFDNVGTLYGVKRLGFEVLDVIKYLVNYYTNNQISVVSNYLTTNQYAIIRGSALGLALAKSKYFSISLETLFTELRKKLNLYCKIDGNTLYIEPEADFFDSTVVYSLADLPYDITKEVDVDRQITKATVGSGKTDVSNNYTSNLPFAFDKWNDVQYSNCSCTFDKDNDLDLSSEFVIDSDVIHDTLANGGNEDDIFLIELFGGEPRPFAQVPLAARWYNGSLRNSQVVNRWTNYLLNCVIAGTENSLWNATGQPFTDNQPFDAIQDNGSTFVSSCNLLLRYPSINIDPLLGGLQVNQGNKCNISNQFYTSYEIREARKYAFRASKIFKWRTQLGTTSVVDKTFVIEVYTDATLSSLAFSWQTQDINYSIPPNSAPANPSYFVDDMEVVTPVWTIPVGYIVVVKFDFVLRSGLSVSFSAVDGVFEYAAELLQCENRVDDFNLNVPYKYTFSSVLCDDDFNAIDAMKEGTIEIAGVPMYVSEVTQDIKGETSFVLLSNSNICCDA